jgi:four helix bundle protein
MNYSEWEQDVPEGIKNDPPWKVKAYRMSLLLSDLAWHDIGKIGREWRTRAISDQLYRAVGSIGANLVEGYSRGTGKDRARFYEYALGSIRESRDWYYKSKSILEDETISHRLDFLAEKARLLLSMINDQRRAKRFAEPRDDYVVSMNNGNEGYDDEAAASESIFRNIPTTG